MDVFDFQMRKPVQYNKRCFKIYIRKMNASTNSGCDIRLNDEQTAVGMF